MMRNGKCSPQLPLVPRTIGKGYSLLPTPTVMGLTQAIGSLLRSDELWQTTSNMRAFLVGWVLGLTGRTKASALAGYGRPIVHRVDDGDTSRLDDALWAEPRRPHQLGRIDTETAKSWIPRLKALGNGITPQQPYAIAACILIAEGYPVPEFKK